MLYGDIEGRLSGGGTALIDSFEDGNTDEYTIAYGSSSDFTVVDETDVTPSARDGSKLLEVSHDNSSQTYVAIGSSSGLNNYPQKGDAIDYWLYSGDWSGIDFSGFTHCWQDADNRFRTRVESGRLKIVLESGGTLATNTASFAVSDSTWYRVTVTWDDGATFGGNDGEQTATVYDSSGTQQAQTSLTDASLTGPDEIRWFMQSDGSSYSTFFDYAHL